MKIALLVFAILVSSPMPAAACHLFSIWKYPWPQRCLGRLAADTRNVPRPAPARTTGPPSCAPVAPLVIVGDAAHAVAIETLKKAMEAKQ